MKRMYNKIPLGSVLSLIVGFQKIRVINGNEHNSFVEFEGRLMDKYKDGINWKLEMSELHGIELDGDTLVFRVNNKYEEF